MRSRSYDKLGLSQNGSITDKPTGRLKKGQLMEPWYLSYAILGCTMGGMIPILIPLLAFKRFSSACHVGLVMAAFNLGGLVDADFWQCCRSVWNSPGVVIRCTNSDCNCAGRFIFHQYLLALVGPGHDTRYWDVRGDDCWESIHRGNSSENRMERTNQPAAII